MPYIDVADDTRSLHAIGDFVMSYDVHMNAFLDALVNRIAFTIVTSKEWNDPWARFDRGMMEYGETVEEIFAIESRKQHNHSSEIPREAPSSVRTAHVRHELSVRRTGAAPEARPRE